jgi:site-specific DNA-methyltransferase (adenine-specific)
VIVHVLRKPLAPGLTVAANALQHGCGALAIDACRVGLGGENLTGGGGKLWSHYRDGTEDRALPQVNTSGRWPANLILSHLPGCRQSGTKQVAAAFKPMFFKTSIGGKGTYSGGKPRQAQGYGDETGHEEVAVWECVENCPVKALDRQSGLSISRQGVPRKSSSPGMGYGMTHTGAEYTDTGTASRFFQQVQDE